MPSGVYYRSEAHKKRMKENLAKGHTSESRAKAIESNLKINQTEEWRERVSEGTKVGMHKPATRKKHLAGLQIARKKHGVNFKGGNGQPPYGMMIKVIELLEPLGFIREYPVKTKGHGTLHTPPSCYKIDFAYPEWKLALEFDGPSHRPRSRRVLDKKKNAVLRALGWFVLRISHE